MFGGIYDSQVFIDDFHFFDDLHDLVNFFFCLLVQLSKFFFVDVFIELFNLVI